MKDEAIRNYMYCTLTSHVKRGGKRDHAKICQRENQKFKVPHIEVRLLSHGNYNTKTLSKAETGCKKEENMFSQI